jgi:WD40 repeat protein
MTALKFHPDGNQIASGDSSGQIRIWSVGQYSNKAPRVFSEIEEVSGLFFDHSGSILAISTGGKIRIRNLSIADEAESFVLLQREMMLRNVAFHPTDQWLVVVALNQLLFYPASSRYPYKLQGEEGNWHSSDINFTPDGSSVITAFPGEPIQSWSVPRQGSYTRRDLWKTGGETRTAVDPLGRYILARSGDEAHLISLKNGMAEGLPVILHEVDDVAFSANGKFAAAAGSLGIEIWDVENKTVRILPLSKGKYFWSLKFSPDGSIFSADVEGNLWQFDVRKNTGNVLAKGKGIVYDIAVANSGSQVAFTISSATSPGEWERATWDLILYDVTEHKSRKIVSHGNRVFSVAFDPSGKTLVTGSMDGIVRVGPITDDPPHVLFGSERAVWEVAVDPAGKWIASAERQKAVVSLWSMPQGKPFHTLPHYEFLNRLRALTNVRVVEDKNSSIGYRVEYAPFAGWEKVPTW